jgi:hypothetical protein
MESLQWGAYRFRAVATKAGQSTAVILQKQYSPQRKNYCAVPIFLFYHSAGIFRRPNQLGAEVILF